jgi:histidine ammonia-lyase
MFILRINTLAKGRSGIQIINLKKFIHAYNAGFVPLVPEQGTVGASGDLAPLAHLALGLLGEGLAWDEKRGIFGEAGKILEELGLSPLELKEKEGLALINGTQFMAAFLSSAAI